MPLCPRRLAIAANQRRPRGFSHMALVTGVAEDKQNGRQGSRGKERRGRERAET
jgi:hypothetical protein